MASEKPKHRDRVPASNSLLQLNEELGFGSINNEAPYSTGIVDAFPNLNVLLPSPHLHFADTHNMPQSYSQETPLPDINLISDVSQFNSSQISKIDHDFLYGPISDFPHSEGSLFEICQLPTLNDTVMNAATDVNTFQKHQIDRNYIAARDNALGCLQMCRQGGEENCRNTHRLQLAGSSLCRGGSTPMLGHAPYDGETGTNNKGMISSVQSNYPEKLDGSFLTLGVGGNTVARSNFNVSSRDITHKTERNVHPQLNTSYGQKADISLLDLANMAHSFSSFQNNEGGFSCVAQNVGGISSLAQSVGGYTGLAQNVGRLTEWPSLSYNDLQVMCNNSTAFNSSSFDMSQMPQLDKHHYNKPHNWNLGLGENRNVRFANIDPHRGFQSYQAISSEPLSSSQGGMPDSGQFKVPEWPSLSSFMTRKTTQWDSGQLQQHYMGSVGNFSSDPYVVSPLVGIAESNTKQDQSVAGRQFPGYQGSATQTTESGLFPKNIVLPFANQTFPANQGSAVQVAEDPMNVGVQPAGNLDRTQPIGLVQASKNIHGPAGQVIPVANASKPSQASNVPVGPSHKRSATQPPSATPEGQHRKARSKISVRPSIPNLAQIAPPVKPLAHIARPPLAQTTLPPIHIKWQGPDETPRPSGQKCVLCKRDLSYTPDGPFVQPAIPPAVAVLPCGHCFHDHCLQRITPEDQAKNPPCIPCVIGEN